MYVKVWRFNVDENHQQGQVRNFVNDWRVSKAYVLSMSPSSERSTDETSFIFSFNHVHADVKFIAVLFNAMQ